MSVAAVSSVNADNVSATIKQTAQSSGANFDYLLNQAKLESSLNSNAQAPSSSALGLYQFTSGTWLNLIKQYGSQYGLGNAATALAQGQASAQDKSAILDLRRDPTLSTQMAAQYAVQNAHNLSAAGFSNIQPQDLYLAHFLGSNGAIKFLQNLQSNPNGAAANALPAAAQANPSIFYSNGQPTSFQQIYTRFQSKFASSNIPTANQYESAAAALSSIAAGKNLTQIQSQNLDVPQLNQIEGAATKSAPNTTISADAQPDVSTDVLAHYLNAFDQQNVKTDLKAIEPNAMSNTSSANSNMMLNSLQANELFQNPIQLSNLMSMEVGNNADLSTGTILSAQNVSNSFSTPLASFEVLPKLTGSTDQMKSTIDSVINNSADSLPNVLTDAISRPSHLSSILYMPTSPNDPQDKAALSDTLSTPQNSKSTAQTPIDPLSKSRQWTSLWSLGPQKS